MNSFITKLALLLSLLFFGSLAFAQSASQVAEVERFIERINTVKLSLPTIEDEIDQALVKYQSSLYARTLITVEKVNIFSQSMPKRMAIDSLQALDTEWQNYAKANKLGSEEYRAWASLESSMIPYLPLTELIEAGKKSTQYNNEALKIDKNNALAYLQLGVGALFTPKVGGGGVDVAISFLENAQSKAQTKYQKYLCSLWLSQAYFKKKDNKKYDKQIAAAEAPYGKTNFIQIIEEYNSKGKIIGE